jgi:hypothetical protein
MIRQHRQTVRECIPEGREFKVGARCSLRWSVGSMDGSKAPGYSLGKQGWFTLHLCESMEGLRCVIVHACWNSPALSNSLMVQAGGPLECQ